MTNISNEGERYDFIVVGAGAAGSVLAAELSASGAQVLVIESGGRDDAPTIANPGVWFYNVGGPLDYHLPITPLPQLNNRNFNMTLGHVLGGQIGFLRAVRVGNFIAVAGTAPIPDDSSKVDTWSVIRPACVSRLCARRSRRREVNWRT